MILSRRSALGSLAATAAIPCLPAYAREGEIRIAHVYSRTGYWLDFVGIQQQYGLMRGLHYGTGGTMTINGKKLVVIEKDDQGRPDVGKSLLSAAYTDDNVDIAVGPTSSSVALAMLPVANEAKRILIINNAVSDSITGSHWNKYVFRTVRNSSQEAVSSAVALDEPDVHIATLATDFVYGRDGVKAFKSALKNAHVVHEEYLPSDTTDFTAGGQRIIDKLKDLPGRKVIWIYWSAAGNVFNIKELGLDRYGIELSTINTDFNTLSLMKGMTGLQGSSYYYYTFPENPMNDTLVADYVKEFDTPPDTFVMLGFSTGMAIVTALKRTQGETDSEKLIAAMEGMSFDTPKGVMTFRKEDHQAMQSMYEYEIGSDTSHRWAVPELVREIKPAEIDVPILNGR